MKIGNVIKNNQPDIYINLNKNFKGKKNKKQEKLTERDIKDLMGTNSYRRGRGGAIRQVGFSGE